MKSSTKLLARSFCSENDEIMKPCTPTNTCGASPPSRAGIGVTAYGTPVALNPLSSWLIAHGPVIANGALPLPKLSIITS